MSEEKLALILGTEGDGLASSTIADCDYGLDSDVPWSTECGSCQCGSLLAAWKEKVKKCSVQFLGWGCYNKEI